MRRRDTMSDEEVAYLLATDPGPGRYLPTDHWEWRHYAWGAEQRNVSAERRAQARGIRWGRETAAQIRRALDRQGRRRHG